MSQNDLSYDFNVQNIPGQWLTVVADITAACSRLLCLPNDLDGALVRVLEQLCKVLSAQRAYLYQPCGVHWNLWHEWYPDVKPPFHSCPSPSGGSLTWKGLEPILLHTLDPLQTFCPSLYDQLVEKGASSAAMILLEEDGIFLGCLGVDNPDPSTMNYAGPLLKIVGCAMTTTLRLSESEQKLEHLRLYDHLTGVFHRGIYLQELQTDRLNQNAVGIIRFQITDLKQINESLGYAKGDELLIKSIHQISNLFGSSGKLYRVGGDEFAVICEGLARERFETLAVQVSPLLEQSLQCAVAVGFQWSSRPGTLQRLDSAAKSMMMEERQQYLRIQALKAYPYVMEEDVYGMLTVEGITTLLQDERFIVYLQPKISFQDETLVGAEALVRFIDSSNTIVEPSHFLPDLESAMLIQYVDLYVLECVCRLIRAWLDENWSDTCIPISVNFSRVTLSEPNLIPHLLHICHKYDIEPNYLEVEISGGMEKQQPGNLSKIVDKIRAAGFMVSVDDFGIRFANLSLLIALDCDKLKVDRSLVEPVTTNPKAQSVLKALSALCTATSTRTTIEGIETEEQLSMLKHMGFDEMQGYLISQPLTIDEFRRKYLSVTGA